MLLVDTGVWLSAADADEPRHADCARLLRRHRADLVTPAPVVAEFTRLPGPARAELFWQAPSFRREPLASDVCFHLPEETPKQLERDARY